MRTYLKLVERFWLPIIAAIGLVTVLFGIQLGSLAVDSNPYLLPEEHPARKPIFDIQKKFTGTWDAVLIAVESDSTVFNPTTLRAILAITQESRLVTLVTPEDSIRVEAILASRACSPELAQRLRSVLEGGIGRDDYFTAVEAESLAVKSSLPRAERSFLQYLPRRIKPIKEVASIAGTKNILAADRTLLSRSSLEDAAAADSASQVRVEVMNNAMMVGSVVTRDEKVALIAVELFLRQDDADGQLRAYDRFQSIVDKYRESDAAFRDKVHIAGVPIFIAEQKKLMDRDFGLLFPLVTLVVAAMLVFFFRKPLGVFLPLLNVVMCTIWTLGVMALTKVPMDLITSALPVFLITICGADAIHMMAEYYRQRSMIPDRFEAVLQTMREMTSPVVLTTVTSVLGFVVSTSIDISSMKTFGIFMAVGLVAAQIISLLLIPAILLKVPYKPEKAVEATEETSAGAAGWLERSFVSLLRRRKPAIAILAIVCGAAALMATRIQVEDKGSEYFAKDNGFRISDEFINSRIAGTSPGWLAFESKDGSSMLTPARMAFLERVDSFLVSQENVTYSYSLPKYVKRMNLVLHDMDPVHDAIPGMERVGSAEGGVRPASLTTGGGLAIPAGDGSDTESMIRQTVLMYENGGGTDLTNVLSKDQASAATMFTMNTTIASDYELLLASLHGWLAENQPADLQATIGGSPVIWSGVLAEILGGQEKGVLLGYLAVLAALALWLRSLRAGFLASLPLVISVLFFFAFMATFRIDLNIGTSIIAFLVIGIVDYSVHFMLRVRNECGAGTDLDEAIARAVRSSGKSILFNIAIFSVGFLCLLFSKFAPVRNLGLLVSMALLLNGFLSMVLIALFYPWLGALVRKAKP